MTLRSHETPDTSSPFVIRGHHLYHFSKLLRSGMDPDTFAFQDACFYLRAWRKAKADNDHMTLAYIEDVAGERCSQATKRREGMNKIMSEFLDSSPFRPLEVVAAKPDTVCGAAVIGRHCIQRYASLTHQDYCDRDGEKVDDFADRAKEMGFGDYLTTFPYAAEFSDSSPLHLVGLRTVMLVGWSVLDSPAYRWENDPTVVPMESSTPKNTTN